MIEENKKTSDERIIELGKWLMEGNIKFELDTKFVGEEVCKTIKIKCIDVDNEDKERNLYIIIQEGDTITQFYVGELEDE